MATSQKKKCTSYENKKILNSLMKRSENFCQFYKTSRKQIRKSTNSYNFQDSDKFSKARFDLNVRSHVKLALYLCLSDSDQEMKCLAKSFLLKSMRNNECDAKLLKNLKKMKLCDILSNIPENNMDLVLELATLMLMAEAVSTNFVIPCIN